jgi:UDP-N-acetylmuramoylalanine--D-glutamate ligase
MALAFGIGPEVIRRAVQKFPGVAHRLETVSTIEGVRYVNNSMCTNPAAVAASLEAAGDRPVVAIAGGRHKGGDLAQMISALHRGTRHIILIGESAPEIGKALESETNRVGSGPAIDYATTLQNAVACAASVAMPGNIVMLIPGCSSFDMFHSFEHRGQVFRDAVMALSEEKTRKESKV